MQRNLFLLVLCFFLGLQPTNVIAQNQQPEMGNQLFMPIVKTPRYEYVQGYGVARFKDCMITPACTYIIYNISQAQCSAPAGIVQDQSEFQHTPFTSEGISPGPHPQPEFKWYENENGTFSLSIRVTQAWWRKYSQFPESDYSIFAVCYID